MRDNATVFVYLVEHLVLTALPLIAAMLFAARLGVRRVAVLLAIGLACSGAIAMLSFWAFYADPLVGESFAYLTLFGSVALIVGALRGGGVDSALTRSLMTPVALWALGSLFLLFLGFLHGGTDFPLAASATRFSGQLPSDNEIPQFFANWFFENGHAGQPPIFPGEWLSSDRPPLQIGYVLSQRPFGWEEPNLQYEVLGLILQQLWIVALWALLVAAKVSHLTRVLVMIAVLVSDLAILNGFFVWPKMLPAAMLLAVAALVLTPLWSELRRSLWAAVLIATLLGVAMLGHGSSVFGILPILVLAAMRGMPNWRWLGVASVAAVVLVAPWSAYQRYADPPGNRLVKWQIGGEMEIDERGVSETIFDSYREVGLDGTLHNKGQNVVAIVGGKPALDHGRKALEMLDAGDSAGALREIRAVFFFNLLPSLGLLLLAPVVIAAGWRRIRRDSAEWCLAMTCFAVVLVGAIAWTLLMFGGTPGSTVIHQGSYLVPILGFCGAVLGLRATLPRFAVYYVAISALLMLAVYVPAVDPLPDTSYSPLAALLAAAGLSGFIATALRGDPISAGANTLAG